MICTHHADFACALMGKVRFNLKRICVNVCSWNPFYFPMRIMTSEEHKITSTHNSSEEPDMLSGWWVHNRHNTPSLLSSAFKTAVLLLWAEETDILVSKNWSKKHVKNAVFPVWAGSNFTWGWVGGHPTPPDPNSPPTPPVTRCGSPPTPRVTGWGGLGPHPAVLAGGVGWWRGRGTLGVCAIKAERVCRLVLSGVCTSEPLEEGILHSWIGGLVAYPFSHK